MILSYDIVLDASDNVATRYLLNDACILSQKPLVSGSALRFEGQVWCIYDYVKPNFLQCTCNNASQSLSWQNFAGSLFQN